MSFAEDAQAEASAVWHDRQGEGRPACLSSSQPVQQGCLEVVACCCVRRQPAAHGQGKHRLWTILCIQCSMRRSHEAAAYLRTLYTCTLGQWCPVSLPLTPFSSSDTFPSRPVCWLAPVSAHSIVDTACHPLSMVLLRCCKY